MNNFDDALPDLNATPPESIREGSTADSQPLTVPVRLQSIEHSEQPIFSNFTAVQGASGVVFVDFAFLEPQMVAALSRIGQPGVKIPEAIPGKLACRVAITLEAAANLSSQLTQLLRNAAVPKTPSARSPAQSFEAEPSTSSH